MPTLPGFVNAHSHAFQRALRGRVERVDPAHPRDDVPHPLEFWSVFEHQRIEQRVADQLDIYGGIVAIVLNPVEL